MNLPFGKLDLSAQILLDDIKKCAHQIETKFAV